MYTQTVKVYVWQPSVLGAYRMLREHNHFGILESVRLAFWLAHGNPMFAPGEFRAWADRQIEEHPFAIGIVIGAWAYGLIVWFAWMLLPHVHGRIAW